MNGVLWEIKTPITSSQKTIKKRIHKASLQSNHIIFDLRHIKPNAAEQIQKDIIKRFTEKRTLRRMLLISNDGALIDFRK